MDTEKHAKVQAFLQELGSPYAPRSALMERLSMSLAKKLSKRDVEDLELLRRYVQIQSWQVPTFGG